MHVYRVHFSLFLFVCSPFWTKVTGVSDNLELYNIFKANSIIYELEGITVILLINNNDF
jgi:hypothetical protein